MRIMYVNSQLLLGLSGLWAADSARSLLRSARPSRSVPLRARSTVFFQVPLPLTRFLGPLRSIFRSRSAHIKLVVRAHMNIYTVPYPHRVFDLFQRLWSFLTLPRVHTELQKKYKIQYVQRQPYLRTDSMQLITELSPALTDGLSVLSLNTTWYSLSLTPTSSVKNTMSVTGNSVS